MRNVLTDPDRFFGELSTRDMSIEIPFIIVLITGIIFGIDVAIVGAITEPLPPEGGVPFGGGIAVLIIIAGLVISFGMWFLFASVFYVISMLFGGKCSFKRCLGFTGYGLIPSTISAVIILAATVAVYLTVDFTSIDPQLVEETFTQNPLIRASDSLDIPLMLWSAYIWTFGVKRACNISMRNALITVAVPVGAYILYQLDGGIGL